MTGAKEEEEEGEAMEEEEKEGEQAEEEDNGVITEMRFVPANPQIRQCRSTEIARCVFCCSLCSPLCSVSLCQSTLSGPRCPPVPLSTRTWMKKMKTVKPVISCSTRARSPLGWPRCDPPAVQEGRTG